MNLIAIVLAVSSVCLVSVGQLLMKMAATALSGSLTPLNLITCWPLLGALSAYFASIVLWFFVLKLLPLRLAYPFSALAFVLVPLLAYGVLGEPLSLKWLVGSGLIMLGIVIIAN